MCVCVCTEILLANKFHIMCLYNVGMNFVLINNQLIYCQESYVESALYITNISLYSVGTQCIRVSTEL